MPSLDEERSLIVRLRAGDRKAFDHIYNSYKTAIAQNLYKLLKSWHEVEEVLQELFVRVWEHRERLDDEKSFQAYLYRIATNLVHDYFRKLTKDKALAETIWNNIVHIDPSELLNPEVLADEELMRTIEKLPPQRKLVFKLCKLEGKSYKQVAELLQISEATINDHITKANRFIIENYNKSLPLLALAFCQLMLSDGQTTGL